MGKKSPPTQPPMQPISSSERKNRGRSYTIKSRNKKKEKESREHYAAQEKIKQEKVEEARAPTMPQTPNSKNTPRRFEDEDVDMPPEPVSTPFRFDRTPGGRGATPGTCAMVLHNRTPGGATMQGGRNMDMASFTPQQSHTQQLVAEGRQGRMELARLFMDGMIEKDRIALEREKIGFEKEKMMAQMAHSFAIEETKATNQAIRAHLELDTNFSQGSDNDGLSDQPSRLSYRLPGSATPNTGTPESEKKMPARHRSSQHHGSRNSSFVFPPVEEPMEEGDVYIVEPFARALPGLFPRADTNVSVAAEKEQSVLKVSQHKSFEKPPRKKQSLTKLPKTKAAKTVPPSRATKKPPAGPLRRSSRLQNLEHQDVAEVEVLSESSQPEPIANKKKPMQLPPNAPSFQQTNSSPSTTLPFSFPNSEENSWHEQQQTPPEPHVPETLDSIPSADLVDRMLFSFYPPAPVDNMEITSSSIRDVRTQGFGQPIWHMHMLDIDRYDDNAMYDGHHFVSEHDEKAAYAQQRATNEKGAQEFEAIRKANEATAANMDVSTIIPPEGFDVYANNWGNIFAATNWSCEDCFSPNPETATKCLACDKDRPACKNAIEAGVTTEQHASIGAGGFQFGAAATTTSGNATSAINLVLGSSSSSNVQAPPKTSHGGLNVTGTASIGPGATSNMVDSSGGSAPAVVSASGSSASALSNAPANGFVFSSINAPGSSNTEQGRNGKVSSASADSIQGGFLFTDSAATASVGPGGFHFVASTNLADSSGAAPAIVIASGSSVSALSNASANGFVFGRSSSAPGPSNTQQGLNGNGRSAPAP